MWSAHVSPFVALSPVVHHEDIFFLIHSSFHHDTRTRTTIGTRRCEDIVARHKDDGISYDVSSPCCNIGTTILVRQSKSPEDREIGRRFAPLWAVLLVPKLPEILPDRDAKCTFIVPSLGVRAQILSICDCRNGVGNPVFKLAPLGHDPLFDITAPNFCELSVSDVVLRHFFVKQALRLRIAR